MESAPRQAEGTQSDASHELDAQTMVINSLRSQINDLYSQVTLLNGQLVKSYNRVSDLEDDLHMTSDKLRSSTVKISELEMEKTQHLSALNTGLLVEKSQVTSELSRLMERATEEAAQRGQAESARQQIEKELDDLAASLFEKANTMVAEARFAQSKSENKVDVAHQALKSAEEAVSIMQTQMQNLQAQKEEAERKAETARRIMEKGKWVDKSLNEGPTVTRRLMSSHPPYQEFMLFITHLRSAHTATPSSQPPAVSTLLALPFISRLVAEDAEPTVRLDLAPSLNWLSRRSVLAAMHHGQLTIEPMSSHTLLLEIHHSQSPLPGFNSSTNTICCALCGASMFTLPEARQRTISNSLVSLSLSRTTTSMTTSTWFKNPLSPSTQPSPPPTPPLQKPQDFNNIPPQVHVFRLSPSNATPINGTIVPTPSTLSASSSSVSAHTTPLPPQPTQAQLKPSAIYPLCTDGWCLARLRTTCSLWAFVRTGIVERIWEEEVPVLPTLSSGVSGAKSPVNGNTPASPEKPKRRGLWGMASALSERASGWTSDTDKEKKEEKKLPPPPIHPPAPHRTSTEPLLHAPPPLPRRNLNRENTSPTSSRFVAPPLEDYSAQKVDANESAQVTPEPIAPKPITPESIMPEPVMPEPIIPESAAPEPAREAVTPEPSSPEPPRSPPPNISPRARPLSNTVLANEAAKMTESSGYPSPRIRSRPSSGVIREAPPRAMTPPPRPPPRAPRPMSPRAVPLPDSRPGTPMQSQFPTSGSVENIPPRSSSPAPTGGVPPIPPRRPARRARPISAANVPAPPSRPATPAQAVLPEEPMAADKLDVGDVTASVEHKTLTSEEIPAAEENKEAAKVEEPVTRVVNVQQPTPTPPLPASTGSLGDVSEGLKDAVADEPLPRLSQEVSDDQKEIAKVISGDEETQGTYVGNATWEERTWKELVRLRQEMFWARTGCVYT